jgi:peptide/nickel transport system permease protein
MSRYILRRLVLMVVTVWVVISIIFFLFRLMPSEPTALIIGPALRPEAQNALKKAWGLDQPVYIQYVVFWKNLLKGEFGISFRSQQPVMDMLGGKIWNTISLMGVSMGLALVLGTAIGTVLAWKRGTIVDTLGILISLGFRSAPIFWTGMIFLGIFSYKLRWLPIGKMHTVGYAYTNFFEKFFSWDFAYHLFLPVFTMTIFYMATPMLVARNGILDVLHDDFIEMCKAKGLSDTRIMFRHAMRNAMLPVVTITTLMVGFAIGGSVLLEKVFSWPGMGRELVDAVSSSDYPTVQACFFFLSILVVLANFLADVLYAYLDPRVKLE